MRREALDNDWGPPVNLGATVNSTADESAPRISADGLELYFSGRRDAYARPGSQGRGDLWMTKRATRDDPWGEPVNLGATVNSAAQDVRPSISVDGLLLFFDSDRPGGYGRADIWVTRRTARNEPWSEPVNLGPAVNSPAAENFPYLSSDGSTLYYESDRPGGYGAHDIWQVPVIALGSSRDPNVHLDAARHPNERDHRKEVVPEENQ